MIPKPRPMPSIKAIAHHQPNCHLPEIDDSKEQANCVLLGIHGGFVRSRRGLSGSGHRGSERTVGGHRVMWQFCRVLLLPYPPVVLIYWSQNEPSFKKDLSRLLKELASLAENTTVEIPPKQALTGSKKLREFIDAACDGN
jgi:hypothetical protein